MKKRFRLIISAFAVSFVIMAALSFYSIEQLSALTNYSNEVDNTNNVLADLHRVESFILDIDRKERGYMITRDSQYLNSLFTESKRVMDSTQSLQSVVDSQQKRTLTLLRGALAMRLSAVRSNINYIQDTAHTAYPSPYYNEGIKYTNESLTYINEMQRRERELLIKRTESKEVYERNAATYIVYLLVVFGIITLVLFILMIRELKKRMEYQEELITRMSELKRSHAELEQIAFAASHDLQEPLRKIRVFSDRLSMKFRDKEGDERELLDRMNHSAGRMQSLIEDIGNLTSLIKHESEKTTVDLNRTYTGVINELSDVIAAKNAEIHTEPLPEIDGYPRQLSILFKSLLDNALKFSRPGVHPRIYIKYDKVNEEELLHIDEKLSRKSFHRISISDNGIGFENKYAEKMFQIFQRLHNQESEYDGKGIGLALCQRIMVNHEGYILAHGHTEIGATFKLFFPISGE